MEVRRSAGCAPAAAKYNKQETAARYLNEKHCCDVDVTVLILENVQRNRDFKVWHKSTTPTYSILIKRIHWCKYGHQEPTNQPPTHSHVRLTVRMLLNQLTGARYQTTGNIFHIIMYQSRVGIKCLVRFFLTPVYLFFDEIFPDLN